MARPTQSRRVGPSILIARPLRPEAAMQSNQNRGGPNKMNAPWKPAGVAHREPFVAYVCDETTAEALRPIVSEMGWSVDKVNKGGLRNAVQSLSVSASPQVLFVDLSESGDPLNDINA